MAQQVIVLQNNIDENIAYAQLLEEQQRNGDVDDIYGLAEQISSVRKAIEKDSAVLKKKMGELGIEDAQRVKTLLNSAYLKLQANMLSTKERIRSRLVNRKFELATFERSARRVGANGENSYIMLYLLIMLADEKLGAHVLQAIKNRDPGISRLVRTFNNQREKMRTIISRQRDGAQRVLPEKIEINGLYKLDIDDSIWQQAGLENNGATVPAWMSDINTGKGIRARLSLDRCLEEEDRIIMERCTLQEWAVEEWEATTQAKALSRE